VIARWKIPIALAVVIAAVAWLAVSGVARNDMYMSTLAQWDPARARHETVRVMGFVKEGSIVKRPGELVTDFVIRDEKATLFLPVRYHGVTPDLFREGTNVIAAGKLGEDGVFAAHDLMTKCPSKYEGVKTPHGEGMPAASPESSAPSTAGPKSIGT
jgi:cytochrome c-type biogenesis protein CcmE